MKTGICHLIIQGRHAVRCAVNERPDEARTNASGGSSMQLVAAWAGTLTFVGVE